MEPKIVLLGRRFQFSVCDFLIHQHAHTHTAMERILEISATVAWYWFAVIKFCKLFAILMKNPLRTRGACREGGRQQAHFEQGDLFSYFL